MRTYFLGEAISAPVHIRSNITVYDSDTADNLPVQSLADNQRWEVSFEVVPEDRAGFFFKLARQVGRKFTLEAAPPYDGDDFGQADLGALTAKTAAAAEAASVTISKTGSSGVLKANQFVRFQGHNKLYAVEEDTTITSAGAAVSIWPALRTKVAADERLYYWREADRSQVRLTLLLKLDRGVVGIEYTDGLLANSGTLRAVETP